MEPVFLLFFCEPYPREVRLKLGCLVSSGGRKLIQTVFIPTLSSDFGKRSSFARRLRDIFEEGRSPSQILYLLDPILQLT
jgi:hypothetical protein